MTQTEKSREQSHNGGVVRSEEFTNAVTIFAGLIFVIALIVYAATLAPTVVSAKPPDDALTVTITLLVRLGVITLPT